MFGFLLYGKKMAYDNKNDKLMKRVSDKNIPDYCLVKKKYCSTIHFEIKQFFLSVNYIEKGNTAQLSNSLKRGGQKWYFENVFFVSISSNLT